MDMKPLTAQQLARIKLRDHFVRTMNELDGQPCNILTYEKTMLHAIFAAWKPDGSEIVVIDLKTPANICMQSARLRMPDILSIQFENPIQLP